MMMHPLHGVEIAGPLLTPLWSDRQEFSLCTFLSHSPRLASMYSQIRSNVSNYQ